MDKTQYLLDKLSPYVQFEKIKDDKDTVTYEGKVLKKIRIIIYPESYLSSFLTLEIADAEIYINYSKSLKDTTVFILIEQSKSLSSVFFDMYFISEIIVEPVKQYDEKITE